MPTSSSHVARLDVCVSECGDLLDRVSVLQIVSRPSQTLHALVQTLLVPLLHVCEETVTSDGPKP